MKITHQLKLGFGLLIGLFLLLAAVVVWQGRQVRQSVEDMQVANERYRQASLWNSGLRENMQRYLAQAYEQGSSVAQLFAAVVPETVKRINAAADAYTALAQSPQAKERLEGVQKANAAFREARNALRELREKGQMDAAQDWAERQFRPATERYLAALEQMQQAEWEQVQVAQAGMTAAMARMDRWGIALALVAAAISVLVSWRLSRTITQGLAHVLRVSQRIGQGDLSQPIRAQARDEIGDVLRALAATQGNLVQLVGRVRQNADGVLTASGEIAQGNQDLSARTENQASALQETAAATEQLSSTVSQNAARAHQADHMARSARGAVQQGGRAMDEVVLTMRGIEESSQRIAEIIGVIDGIAFQTNILALNAAVEAARAGEQGRGFAVVAGEVRSLAGRSAEAAKEIKLLIGESAQRTADGSAQVAQAGKAMEQLVAEIAQVTEVMAEISSASAEQSQGVSQVGEAIGQIDQVTQQNAALVEEMAAAASSLKAQAHEMVSAVAVFQLDAGAARAPQSPQALLAG